jgi:hypothetical protein
VFGTRVLYRSGRCSNLRASMRSATTVLLFSSRVVVVRVLTR